MFPDEKPNLPGVGRVYPRHFRVSGVKPDLPGSPHGLGGFRDFLLCEYERPALEIKYRLTRRSVARDLRNLVDFKNAQGLYFDGCTGWKKSQGYEQLVKNIVRLMQQPAGAEAD